MEGSDVNAARRKAIREIITRLSDAQRIVDEARGDLEALKEEEEEYRDAIPESLQSGEKYENAEAAIQQMEEALETIDNLSFDDLASQLEEACS